MAAHLLVKAPLPAPSPQAGRGSLAAHPGRLWCGLETAPPWGFEISLQRYYIILPFVGQVRPIITGRVFFLQASPPASPPLSPLKVV